jgi:hypothetical protein
MMTVRDLLKLPEEVKRRYPVRKEPTASTLEVLRPKGREDVFSRADVSSYIKARLVRYFFHNAECAALTADRPMLQDNAGQI